jgi:aspartate/methionine/tyrosine aminotransferase
MQIPSFKLEEFWKKYQFDSSYLLCCSDTENWKLHEILALIALRAKNTLLKRNCEIMFSHLEILNSFMKRNRKLLSWDRPQSDTLTVVKLLLPVPLEKFTEELVEKTGVLIMPGPVFDFSGNFFRIGFEKKIMIQGLERFEQFLINYGKSYGTTH